MTNQAARRGGGRVRCTVEKLVVVEADNPEEAERKLYRWDVLDEIENEQSDWNILSGPKELK